MRWLFLCFSWGLMLQAFGQDILLGPNNAATWILGNGHAAYQNGGLYSNPATIANLEAAEISLTAANRFAQRSLFDGQVQYIHPSTHGYFAGGIRFFGDGAYNEQLGSLAYARKLGDQIRLGVAGHYMRQQIDIYGDRQDILLSLGLQARLVSNLDFGFSVQQTLGNRVTEFENHLNIWSSGICYSFNNEAQILISILKESQSATSLQLGIEFPVLKSIVGRLGLETLNETFAFGIGLPLQQFWLDLGTQLHNVLGFSPTMGLKRKF